MTRYTTPENRKKIDVILRENAIDVSKVMCRSMTKDQRSELNARWRRRLAKMRKIDPLFCHFSGFKMYD
jgi:hypothetical protein